MFTWPRPGIQIGSCMRKTPGATSVTSSDAGSCSCLGGRARGWISVMPGRVSCARVDRIARRITQSGVGERRELRPRPVGFGDCTAREDDLLVVAAPDRLQA